MNALRWNKLCKQLCSRLELSTWVLTTLGGALRVDVQQRLDPADVKVTFQDTSVTARPDDGLFVPQLEDLIHEAEFRSL